jgi:hypothetical protein
MKNTKRIPNDGRGLNLPDDLTSRGALYIPFTPEPKKRLRPIKASTKAIDLAVGEGELLARILEHKDVTPEIANCIRVLAVGACLYTAKNLDTHELSPELIRDIYPWGKLAHRKMRDQFMLVMADVKRDMPRMYETTFPNISKGGAKLKAKKKTGVIKSVRPALPPWPCAFD